MAASASGASAFLDFGPGDTRQPRRPAAADSDDHLAGRLLTHRRLVVGQIDFDYANGVTADRLRKAQAFKPNWSTRRLHYRRRLAL